jgi:hypothetical protein
VECGLDHLEQQHRIQELRNRAVYRHILNARQAQPRIVRKLNHAENLLEKGNEELAERTLQRAKLVGFFLPAGVRKGDF